MIQLLPVNDTSVYNMWWDSVPLQLSVGETLDPHFFLFLSSQASPASYQLPLHHLALNFLVLRRCLRCTLCICPCPPWRLLACRQTLPRALMRPGRSSMGLQLTMRGLLPQSWPLRAASSTQSAKPSLKVC